MFLTVLDLVKITDRNNGQNIKKGSVTMKQHCSLGFILYIAYICKAIFCEKVFVFVVCTC